MKPYIETELYNLLENIKATTDVRELSFEEAYLLLKQKIKEKQIPVEIYYNAELLDPNSIWLLDVSELQKPIKVILEDESSAVKYLDGRGESSLMQEKYEQAIRETFEYLRDYRSNAACVFAGSYVEAIEHHMKLLGFEVYCAYDHDQSVIYVYPKENNLPIHIWREK